MHWGAVKVFFALLSLCFCSQTCTASLLNEKGSKCGKVLVQSPLDQSLRIVGGNKAVYGSHPWLVSLKFKGEHFCGASILNDKWLLCAAHCFSSLAKQSLTYVLIVVGEYDQRTLDAGEQRLKVKNVKIHKDFMTSNAVINDIAVVEVDGRITFGNYTQPICLPLPSEEFKPGTSCVVSGWGRLKERGPLPDIVQEVQLNLIDPRTCSNVISTVRPNKKLFSVLCAGPETGEKDACQGDSGGPMVCPRKNGQWTLVGVTSWGKGCGRSWIDNASKQMSNRGSPGVFTDVKQFLPWILGNMYTDTQPNKKSASKLCSTADGTITGTEGLIRNPEKPYNNYENNELCFWSIRVPAGKNILLEFLEFDLENDTYCSSDQLSVFAGTENLVGQFCGSVLPSPILISSSSATIKFTSDFNGSGAGFSVTYKAIDPDSLLASGCGAVAVLQAEGVVQSLRHPDLYSNNAACRWIIYAPQNHVIKMEFEDFELEESSDCGYDSLTVFGDVEEREEIATLCGTSIPVPVLSYDNVMVLQFISDGSISYKGFSAIISFIRKEDLHAGGPDESKEHSSKDFDMSAPENPLDACGMPPVAARFVLSRIVGGEEAIPHSWPWQVSVGVVNEHICGGTVIHPEWILTAAHCVYGFEKKYLDLLVVVAGDHDITTKDPEEQKRSVKEVILHPGYNDISLDYDVALLQLATPLVYNNYVHPVCLPNKSQEVNYSGSCTVSGWGSKQGGYWNSTLQQLEVPVLTAEDCGSLYPGRITESMLCAGSPLTEGQDTCMGDSGGPLVCQSEQSTYFLYGVTSWGFGCGQARRPGVYSSVQVVREWILSRVGQVTDSTKTATSEPKTLSPWMKIKNNIAKKSSVGG